MKEVIWQFLNRNTTNAICILELVLQNSWRPPLFLSTPSQSAKETLNRFLTRNWPEGNEKLWQIWERWVLSWPRMGPTSLPGMRPIAFLCFFFPFSFPHPSFVPRQHNVEGKNAPKSKLLSNSWLWGLVLKSKYCHTQKTLIARLLRPWSSLGPSRLPPRPPAQSSSDQRDFRRDDAPALLRQRNLQRRPCHGGEGAWRSWDWGEAKPPTQKWPFQIDVSEITEKCYNTNFTKIPLAQRSCSVHNRCCVHLDRTGSHRKWDWAHTWEQLHKVIKVFFDGPNCSHS